jgi:hypothetical protein
VTSWNHSGTVVVAGASGSALATRAGDREPRRSTPPPRVAAARDGLSAWTSVLPLTRVPDLSAPPFRAAVPFRAALPFRVLAVLPFRVLAVLPFRVLAVLA